MSAVGLSTLYLLLSEADFNVLVLEIGRDRPEDQAPLCWEVVDEGQHSLTEKRLELLKGLAEVGYRFTVHAPFKDVDIAHPDAARRMESVRRLKRTIDAAAEIEAKLVVLHPGSVFPGNEELNWSVLADLVDYGADVGIPCGIENMLPVRHGQQVRHLTSPADFNRFWSATGSRAGLVFDVAHAFIGGLMDSFVRELARRMVQVHASDTRGDWDEHLNIGEGVIPWHRVVRDLGKAGFLGLYVVESVSRQFEAVSRLKRIIAEALRSSS
jgi:sugar phosphate isomerase/epimerase